MSSYDTVIKNGIIVDGTGKESFKANIGIRKDRIAEISKSPMVGDKIIECNNKWVVAPGFIDMHSHSDLAIFYDRRKTFYKNAALCKISQGVTTEIIGQDGYSAAPLKNSQKKEYKLHWGGLAGDLPVERWKWNTISEYLLAIKQRNFPTKVETLVGHGTIRLNVLDYENRVPDAAELKQMQAILRSSLQQGAVGLSCGLIYPPGMFAQTDELIALAKVVAEEKKVIVAHVRNESDKLFEALAEYFQVHQSAKVKTHISHLKICGEKNLKRGDELQKLVTDESLLNNDISFDMYPYDAGSTMLQAILPPWAHEGGPEALLKRLKSKTARQKMAEDIFASGETAWDNFIGFSKGGMAGIRISNAPKGYASIVSKSLAELGQKQNYEQSTLKGKYETFHYICQLLVDTELRLPMISFNQSMENVTKFLSMDKIMTIGTDGVIGAHPHPRLFGALTKYIRWAIDSPQMTLTQAISNITSHAASIIGIERGQIKKTYSADITIFDRKEIANLGTYENPMRLSTGIKHVLVDGKQTFSEEEGLL